MRLKPSYMIIGGVKCASSSVYRYLNAHPNVLPCKTKEPSYFNKSLIRVLLGYYKYRNLYPDLSSKDFEAGWLDIDKTDKMVASTFKKSIDSNQEYITGEATATSLVRVDPKRVKWLFPNMKAILLLREPTQRYISHFNMFMRFTKEGRKGYDFGPIDDYVKNEINQFSKNQRTRILDFGAYMKFLPKWKKTFGDDLIIMKSSDFENSEMAQQRLSEVCEFLNLPKHDFSEILQTKFNKANSSNSWPKAEALLKEFYEPWNQMLQDQFSLSFK